MSDAPTVEEILTDDRMLLDYHTRREARPGLWILSFAGELMPDGHPAEIQVKGQLNHAALMSACNQVRSIYNERIGREEAAPSEPSAPRNDGGSGDNRPAAGPVGVTVPEAPPVPDIEGTLEAVIESQVARLRGSILDVESRIAELGGQRSELLVELTKAERALGAYNDVLDDKPKRARAKPRRTKKSPSAKRQAANTDDGEAGDAEKDS